MVVILIVLIHLNNRAKRAENTKRYNEIDSILNKWGFTKELPKNSHQRDRDMRFLTTKAHEGNEEALRDLATLLQFRELNLLPYDDKIPNLITFWSESSQLSAETKEVLSKLIDVPVMAYSDSYITFNYEPGREHRFKYRTEKRERGETRYYTLRQFMKQKKKLSSR